ncbi:uncharacterized protein TRIADDRAFT_28230, partial [Trichoplax adhaerens]
GRYDARFRVFVRQLSWTFMIPWFEIELFEESCLQKIIEFTEAEEEEKLELRNKASGKARKYWIIGVAGVGGGFAMALTGGLAAPLIAAGGGALLASASAPVISPNFGTSLLTKLFGIQENHLAYFKTERHFGRSSNCEFDVLTSGQELHFTIAISGYLTRNSDSDFYKQWSMLYLSKEQYILKWERRHLANFGTIIEDILKELVVEEGSGILQQTAIPGLHSLISLPAQLSKAAYKLEKPWSTCVKYAKKVGKQLATVLMKRMGGSRPVSLIGFSLGASVIYYCLEELQKQPNNKGIIESVTLLGAPIERNSDEWEQVVDIIAGKIINAYCSNDWILQTIFRATTNRANIAGLSPIVCSKGRILNVNLSEHVTNHMDYTVKMKDILELLRIPT